MNEKTIESLYERNAHYTFSFSEVVSPAFESFHPKEVLMIEKDDEWFCGLRANHFVVMSGWSEQYGDDFTVTIVMANHKGDMGYTVIVSIKEGILIDKTL